MMEKLAYSIQEVSKIIGICKEGVRALIASGQLRVVRPTPKRIIIPASAIEAYLNDRS